MQVERLVTRLERVVVPMWLVDGQVVGVWQARMGYDYQVESAQERFIDGKGWTTQHLRETRIRWEPRAGRVRRSYENLAVSALEERERAVFQTRLGHYDLERATPYIPENMAGMSVRVPSLLPDEAWPDARTAFDSAAAADCRRGAGAQHHAEFELIADYEKLHWTQMLLPAFVTYYQDDAGHLFPVWVNGQSGRVNGVRRASMRKAWRIAGGAAAVALVTFFAGALAALLSAGSVSSLLLAASFFLLVVAALPVLWAWQFNTQQAYTSRSPDKSVVKLGH